MQGGGISPLPSSAVAAGTPRKTISGLSADDMAVLHSLTPEELARTAEQPVASLRTHWVVLPLDSDHTLPEVAGALGALRAALAAAGLEEAVGLGVLSMLGFDSTRNALEVGGGAGQWAWVCRGLGRVRLAVGVQQLEHVEVHAIARPERLCPARAHQGPACARLALPTAPAARGQLHHPAHPAHAPSSPHTAHPVHAPSLPPTLQSAGVDFAGLDFVVCNSGADMWLQLGAGHWDADEQYEGGQPAGSQEVVAAGQQCWPAYAGAMLRMRRSVAVTGMTRCWCNKHTPLDTLTPSLASFSPLRSAHRLAVGPHLAAPHAAEDCEPARRGEQRPPPAPSQGGWVGGWAVSTGPHACLGQRWAVLPANAALEAAAGVGALLMPG